MGSGVSPQQAMLKYYLWNLGPGRLEELLILNRPSTSDTPYCLHIARTAAMEKKIEILGPAASRKAKAQNLAIIRNRFGVSVKVQA